MTVALKQPLCTDARHEQRTSLFVMATLHADSGSCPVKVRDLSSAGALIEGAVIPPEGMSVRLVRGALTVLGQIMWSRSGRAGLRFDASVAVTDWLPGGRTSLPQQRVDEIVQQVKSAASFNPELPSTQEVIEPKKVSTTELKQLGDAIESLANDLAADPHVTIRHTEKLQILDVVAQTLRKLAIEG